VHVIRITYTNHILALWVLMRRYGLGKTALYRYLAQPLWSPSRLSCDRRPMLWGSGCRTYCMCV